ncbi:MAG: hypothetical protein KVP17_002375, partial [Porospora cf. gigantea B]
MDAVSDVVQTLEKGEENLKDLIYATVKLLMNRDPNWATDASSNLQRIGVLLNTKLADSEVTLKHIPKLLKELDSALDSAETDALREDAAYVQRVLCQRFPADSTFGAKVVTTTLGMKLQAWAGEGASMNKRSVVMDSNRCLAIALNQPASRQQVLSVLEKGTYLKHLADNMNHFRDDPEILASYLDVMQALANDTKGMDLLEKGWPLGTDPAKSGQKRAVGDAITQDLTAHMIAHRTNSRVVNGVLGYFAKMAALDRPTPESLLDANFQRTIDDMACLTLEGLAAAIRLRTALYTQMSKEDNLPAVTRLSNMALEMMNDPSATHKERAPVLVALSGLIERMADCEHHDSIIETRILDIPEKELNSAIIDPKVMESLLCALLPTVDDQALATLSLKSILTPMMVNKGDHFKNQPENLNLFVQVLKKCLAHEGTAQQIRSSPHCSTFINAIPGILETYPKHDSLEIEVEVADIKAKIFSDDPNAITLRSIFAKWTLVKEQGQNLRLSEPGGLSQQADVLAEYHRDYCTGLAHPDVEDFRGSEVVWGAQCWILLHEEGPDNTRPCLERDEVETLYGGLGQQTHPEIVQWLVRAAIKLAEDPPGAEATAVDKTHLQTAASVCHAGLKGSLEENWCRERVQLIAKSAVERNSYNDTKVFQTLVDYWNLVDSQKYSIDLLVDVLHSMRQIANAHWADVVIKNQVPQRLVGIVNDKTAPIKLLPDALFLLGSLSVVPDIKDLIGKINGITSIVNLIDRQLKNTKDPLVDVQRVIANAQLAMSSTNMIHDANSKQFVDAKGIQQNIAVMDTAMDNMTGYEVANASSVLMCNMLFRRDDLKETYGKRKGPNAIMKIIKAYDGSTTKQAHRCLVSMFKAIGNLALYAPNIDLFLSNGVEKVYSGFFTNDQLPDWVMVAGLNSMSNLVMEFTDDSMRLFSVCLKPLMNLLIKRKDEIAIMMFTLSFDIISSLCRLPENAAAFLDAGGMTTALDIVSQNVANLLYLHVIHLIGVVSIDESTIPRLIDVGVFTFLVDVFESQERAEEPSTELCINSLRCTRRMMSGRKSAELFIQMKGVDAISFLMRKTTQVTLIQYEGYRNIIAMLNYFPPPEKEVEDEWDDFDVADEEVSPKAHRVRRGLHPRSWQALEMSVEGINALIDSIISTLKDENNQRALRVFFCGVGLLAYFAVEKIPGTVVTFYQSDFATPI